MKLVQNSPEYPRIKVVYPGLEIIQLTCSDLAFPFGSEVVELRSAFWMSIKKALRIPTAQLRGQALIGETTSRGANKGHLSSQQHNKTMPLVLPCTCNEPYSSQLEVLEDGCGVNYLELSNFHCLLSVIDLLPRLWSISQIYLHAMSELRVGRARGEGEWYRTVEPAVSDFFFHRTSWILQVLRGISNAELKKMAPDSRTGGDKSRSCLTE